MPFLKKVKEPGPPKPPCRVPWFTFFVSDFSLWQCPKCSAQYMIRFYGMEHEKSQRGWERQNDGIQVCKRKGT